MVAFFNEVDYKTQCFDKTLTSLHSAAGHRPTCATAQSLITDLQLYLLANKAKLDTGFHLAERRLDSDFV